MNRRSKPFIVVIEDNPADVQLLELALDDIALECDCKVIQDGAEALAWVRSFESGEGTQLQLPDLAVVDLNLPKNDGIEILTAMMNGRLSGVPALVLSSSPSPRDVARVRAFPNTRYLTKPSLLEQYAELGRAMREMLDSSSEQGASGG